MQRIQAILKELTLAFILTWFFSSVFIDIVAVPSIFKFSNSLMVAGKIGMTVFGRFNRFEIFFALMILLGVLSQKKKSRVFMTLSVFLLGLAFFYTIVMTPAISNAAIKMHSVPTIHPDFQGFKQEHAKFHNLYRTFDSIKLIVLLVFSGLILRSNLNQKRSL